MVNCRRKTRFVNGLLALLPLVLCAALPVPASTATSVPPTVVILNSFHHGHWWTDDQMAGLLEGLDPADTRIDPRVEYMDIGHFPEAVHRQRFLEGLRDKYASSPVAAVLVTGDPALQFALACRNELFPDAAVVFCGLTSPAGELIAGQSRVTGVEESRDPALALNLALRVHPDARKCFMVHDYTPAGLDSRRQVESAWAPYASRVGIEYNENVPLETLVRRVAGLAPGTVILVGDYIQDCDGLRCSPRDLMQRLGGEQCRLPVYYLHEITLGRGAVGGFVFSGRMQGAAVAALARGILAGEDVAGMPVVRKNFGRLVLDYPAMQRFGVPLTAAPADAIVINRPDSLYEDHRLFFGGIGAVILILLAVVAVLGRNVVHRKRVEASLRASEEKYRTLADAANDMIFIIGRDEQVEYVNNYGAALFGVSPPDLIGKPRSALFKGSVSDRQAQHLRAIFDSGQPAYWENKTTFPRGEVWIGTWLAPIFDEEHRVQSVLGIARDITERRKTEDALVAGQRFLQDILNAMQDGISVLDTNLNIVRVNPVMEKLYAHAMPLVGRKCHQVYHGRGERCVVCPSCRAMEKKTPQMEVVPLVGPTGSRGWVEVHAFPMLDATGGVTGVVEHVRDVTEHKRMEDALRITQFTVDHAAFGVVWVDPDARIIYANEAAVRMLGYSHEELLGLRVDDIAPEGMNTKRWARHWQELKEHGSLLFESRHRRKDGSGFPVEISANFLTYQGKEYNCAIVQDITARQQRLAEFHEERNQLRTLVGNLPDLVYIKDVQSRFVLANQALAVLLGLDSPEALVGKTDYDFFPKELAEKYSGDERRILTIGEAMFNHEELVIDKQGGQYWYSSTKVPLRDRGGKIIGLVGIGRNITERKRTEEQLLRAQKMEAIGQLAGGIAHDFNNLLTGIMGYAGILTLETQAGTSTREAAETIERAAERASALTRRLLSFARQEQIHMVPVDLHHVAGEMIALFSRTIDKRVTITQRLHPGEASVRGDVGQLQQVVMNLMMNARDAMPEGGEIVLETSLVELDAGYCRGHVGTKPGRYVQLSVADTGCGIPKEIQARIFDPFFTTKERDKGTGMGLAIVYSIVSNHQGFVQLYSEVGKGTTFKVYLPYSEEKGEATTRTLISPVRGKGTILVIDDDEMIRRLTTSLLRELGYSVMTASTAGEAVACCTKEGAKLDLVLMDMVLPDMDAQACFAAMKKAVPGLRVILSSGYGLNQQAQALMEAGMKGFVQKPFKLHELAATVAHILKT